MYKRRNWACLLWLLAAAAIKAERTKRCAAYAPWISHASRDLAVAVQKRSKKRRLLRSRKCPFFVPSELSNVDLNLLNLFNQLFYIYAFFLADVFRNKRDTEQHQTGYRELSPSSMADTPLMAISPAM